MAGREHVPDVAPAGRVDAEAVAEPGGDPRLVLRDPVRDPVAEAAGDGLRVLDERLRGLPRGPAARVLEHLRQVPVVERHVGLDPGAEQLVHEPVVEVEPRLVHAAPSFREDARPGDREAERIDAELLHQGDVLGIAVVEVARDGAVVAVSDLPGRRRRSGPRCSRCGRPRALRPRSGRPRRLRPRRNWLGVCARSSWCRPLTGGHARRASAAPVPRARSESPAAAERLHRWRR